MLTPDQLEALPRRFVQLWQQVEDDILQDIARRMKSLGELDPLTPTAIWQAWRLAETRAVVVVEHDMEFVRRLDCKVTVLHQGSVLAEGSLDHVSANPDVIEVYLGR